MLSTSSEVVVRSVDMNKGDLAEQGDQIRTLPAELRLTLQQPKRRNASAILLQSNLHYQPRASRGRSMPPV